MTTPADIAALHGVEYEPPQWSATSNPPLPIERFGKGQFQPTSQSSVAK